MKQLILTSFLLIISLSTCIDPFYLELDDYKSHLVVEGMITDELTPQTIKLSRTYLNANASPDFLFLFCAWDTLIRLFYDREDLLLNRVSL